MKRKKSKLGFKNVITTITAVLLFITAMASVMTLLGGNELNNEKTPKDITVYFVPGEIWLEDNSTMGAWVWNDYGVPQSKFVVASDADGDDVYEVKFSEEYTSLLFVDLVPNATELGSDWVNKREQSANLKVPKGKTYYHVYDNTWDDNPGVKYVRTKEIVPIFFDSTNTSNLKAPAVYCFDKYNKTQPTFITMTQMGSARHTANIPAGYTHIVFIDYFEDGEYGSWDNIAFQSEDLIIPNDENKYFSSVTFEWSTSFE
jgi:hypothetical protein